MTGYDFYLHATAMLGMTRESAERSGVLPHICAMLDTVCRDLHVTPPEVLSEQIQTNPAKEEALLYGLAMHLSLACADSAANHFYTELYTVKRARALAQTQTIRDVLPRDNGGVRS